MKKLLLKSRLENRPVEIVYLDKVGKITQRTIFVKKITDDHVVAFCTTREQQRTFYLENILAAEKGSWPHETKQAHSWCESVMGIQSNDAS